MSLEPVKPEEPRVPLSYEEIEALVAKHMKQIETTVPPPMQAPLVLQVMTGAFNELLYTLKCKDPGARPLILPPGH